MSLNNEQINFFRDNGYVPVESFFNPDETRAMQLEIARFKRAGLVRNVATDGDGKTTSQSQKNLQLCPMYDKSDIFKGLPFDSRVVEAISQLIGNPFRLHLDQVFLKPAGDGVGTNWHQDNAYFKLDDPMTGTAMWIAVHDANAINGTMRVIPRVFRDKFEHNRDGNSDHHIRCYPDETKAVLCELKAGGVLFFCYGTPHATGANGTTSDRAGAAFHFLRSDLPTMGSQHDHFRDINPGRPHITGPNASNGILEYGKDMRGAFRHEVAAILQSESVVKDWQSRELSASTCEKTMADLTNPRTIYLKGFLFLAAATLASAALLLEHPHLKTAILLALAVWCFARFLLFCVLRNPALRRSRFPFCGTPVLRAIPVDPSAPLV
jgi:ectoine hydroxylase-related dioxygenase (phytanoyl-CoA dioxygenase family)